MQPPDWSALDHAYGAADDIPALLRQARAAPAPRDYRDEPWFSLWSALCHQGDVFTASYAAVPELVATAEARRSDARAACECLYMAAIIELERAASEGSRPPPPMPLNLAARYREAVQRGAALTRAALVEGAGPDAQEMLEICAASFGGDFVRARLLADGPDEEPE
jgi:hypothetical protein